VGEILVLWKGKSILLLQELLFTEKVLTDQILCEIGSGGTNFTPEQIFCYTCAKPGK
jgi:hypothetical protein